MVKNTIFYTYLWLREDGSPYYVGKGMGRRGFLSHGHTVPCPKEVERIIIQEWLSEDQAYEAEKFLISYFGRIDQGTGCLRNLTDGGEGASVGHTLSESGRDKLRIAKTGKKRPQFSPEWCSKLGIRKGTKRPESTRLKMSKAQEGNTKSLGIKQDETWIRKRVESRRLTLLKKEQKKRSKPSTA